MRKGGRRGGRAGRRGRRGRSKSGEAAPAPIAEQSATASESGATRSPEAAADAGDPSARPPPEAAADNGESGSSPPPEAAADNGESSSSPPPEAAPPGPATHAPLSVREVVARLEGHPAPAQPAASAPPPALTRRFEEDGAEWLAISAGAGMGGTGQHSLARVEAIRFALATAPEQPLREVLLPEGRLGLLYDQELRELLARAQPLPIGPGA